jgi:hypothetical protein
MHRRHFCVSGAALAAGLAAARALPTATGLIGRPPAAGAALYKVIFDTRFAASRDFGMAAACAGRITAGIRGDVTALWCDDIQRQWTASRAPIAGMTTMSSFFCLQQLAKDHWMRAVVTAEHRQPCAGADARVREIVGILPGRSGPRPDAQLVSWVIA